MNENAKNTKSGTNGEVCPVLQKVIDESGLNRKEFADAIGLQIDMVNKMVSGARPLKLSNAMTISKRWGFSLDYLYGLAPESGNDAQSIMDSLQEVFKLKPRKGNSFTIEIDEHLHNLIQDINNAEAARNAIYMKDDLFDLLIKGIMEKYNQNRKTGTAKVVRYFCAPEDSFTTGGAQVANPPKRR